jgi:hypothetical protein
VAFGELTDLLVPFYPTTVIFDSWVAYTRETVNDLWLPRSGGAFSSVEGTSGTPGWYKAVQTTITWRTEDFNHVKVVLLDSASGNTFDPIFSAAADPSTDDLDAYMRSDDCIIAGQDGSRPTTFVRETSTLNEKLRKQYRMD